MKRDPTEYAGVPVELPPRLLDVPLAMRVSHAIADLLRGTLIETKKRNDLTVLASCVQEAALRAAKASDRRSFREPEGGTWAQGACLWMDDAESAARDYRALAAEGKLGVQTGLTVSATRKPPPLGERRNRSRTFPPPSHASRETVLGMAENSRMFHR